jgi:hypothetical protein
MQATPTKIVSNIMETHSDVGYNLKSGAEIMTCLDVFFKRRSVEGNLISLRATRGVDFVKGS